METKTQCQIVMRRQGLDVRCQRSAVDGVRCARHGGERPYQELVTHRAAIERATAKE